MTPLVSLFTIIEHIPTIIPYTIPHRRNQITNLCLSGLFLREHGSTPIIVSYETKSLQKILERPLSKTTQSYSSVIGSRTQGGSVLKDPTMNFPKSGLVPKFCSLGCPSHSFCRLWWTRWSVRMNPDQEGAILYMTHRPIYLVNLQSSQRK